MKKIQSILLLFSLLFLVGLLVFDVMADEASTQAAGEEQSIFSQNITIVSPLNNSFLSSGVANTTNFTFSVQGPNSTYNVTLFINGTARGNASVLNGVTAGVVTNFSLVDGQNYTWFLNVSNGVMANRTNVTFVFTVDTLKPLVSFNTTTSIANASFMSNGTFTVAFFSSDLNYANTTVNLNRNNGSLVNATVFTGTASSITYLSLADGNYTVNVTTLDRAMNRNITQVFSVTQDATAPSPTVSVSPSTTDVGESVTLSCSATDEIDSTPTTSLSIKLLHASSFTTVTSPYVPSTAGTYTVRCTVSDDAGNGATTEATLLVGASSTSGSGGSSGGSSSSSSSSSSDDDETTTDGSISEDD
ncbi:hypothetical protein EXS74_03510, partial [Candidatus Woesearchaeota archaeon]|nr:hypothetical protein [Candidatus Woesearchaeota archaeon]